jgi:hypothetical protein
MNPTIVMGYAFHSDGTVEKRTWCWRGRRTVKPRSALLNVVANYSNRGRVTVTLIAEDWHDTRCWVAPSESMLRAIDTLIGEASAAKTRRAPVAPPAAKREMAA